MNSLFHTRTRHSSRGSRGTARRPTASELAPYKEASALSYLRKKKTRSHDPYMMSTLIKTTGTITSDDGGPYIELDDSKDRVQSSSGEIAQRSAEHKDGTATMENEIHEAM